MTATDQSVRDYADLTELLDHLEGLLRETCFTDPFTRRTTSQSMHAPADGLRVLAKHGRFRIAAERGPRIVAGYWPEHDPLRRKATS